MPNSLASGILQFSLCFLLMYLTDVTATPKDNNLRNIKQNIKINGEIYSVKVPKGYRLELLTKDLNKPRLMTFAENGDLFIGSKSGEIYRLPAPYTKASLFIDFGAYPHSIAIRKNEMFIASTEALYQAAYFPGKKTLTEDEVKKLISLPDTGGHDSRTVAVGPDSRIYLSLGIAGNCSDQFLGGNYLFGDWRGGIIVLNEKEKPPEWEVFASGLRNPVGFDWQPKTREMYASNNGPDHLGFENPPEYFSKLVAGSFHGMPWFQFDGQKIFRDKCISSKPPLPIEKVVKPEVTFPARNAPMGVVFIKPGQMEKKLENNAIVALRGSWATSPSGGFWGDNATRRPPKLVVVQFKNGKAIKVEDFITGFQLGNGERWARPVGVKIGPDGHLYFTSDAGINGLFRLRKSFK